MSRKDDIERLILEKCRRLQILKQRQAQRGINTPPEDLIEIQDIEAEIEELKAQLSDLPPSGPVSPITSNNGCQTRFKGWKIKVVILVLLAIIAAIGVIGGNYILGLGVKQAEIKATQTAEATGTAIALLFTPTHMPEPTPTDTPTPTNTPTPVCIIENFESGRQITWWSPDPEVFNYGETSEQAHNGNQSFKVKYHKNDTYQFIGAELPSNLCDFTKAQTLQVWGYGQVTLLLKLEDEKQNQVDISEQRSTAVNDWTLLTFNYKNAGNSINLSQVKGIFLFPAPGDTSAGGEFFLDDIALFP